MPVRSRSDGVFTDVPLSLEVVDRLTDATPAADRSMGSCPERRPRSWRCPRSGAVDLSHRKFALAVQRPWLLLVLLPEVG